ncbi:MAG: hypothetical protein Q8P67_08790 [archaeon]|nr:hypothetical protein [archaeon]
MEGLDLTEEDLTEEQEDESVTSSEFVRAIRSKEPSTIMALVRELHQLRSSDASSPSPLFLDIVAFPPPGWPRLVCLRASGHPIHYACFFGLYELVLAILTADPSEARNPAGELLITTSAGGGPVATDPYQFLLFRLNADYFRKPPCLSSFAHIERLLRCAAPESEIRRNDHGGYLPEACLQMLKEITLFDLIFETLVFRHELG